MQLVITTTDKWTVQLWLSAINLYAEMALSFEVLYLQTIQTQSAELAVYFVWHLRFSKLLNREKVLLNFYP